MARQSITDLELGDRTALIRVDFNVPLDDDGNVVDDTRIEASLETIRYAIENDARVVLTSHLGRPKGKRDPALSLEPAGACLANLLDDGEVVFADDCIGDGPRKLISDMRGGQVLLLENTRFHPGEKANDEDFAQALAAHAEVYINDAFGTLHRAHASTAGVTRFIKEKAAGFLVEREIEMLSKLREQPDDPFVVVLGGAKVADKIGVVDGLAPLADAFLIGGGMAYTFLAARGVDVGDSLVEEDSIPVAKRLMATLEKKGKRLLLPVDHVCASELAADASSQIVDGETIPSALKGLDVGPATVERFEKEILRAKTVFWNGPLGVYEYEPFRAGTEKLAKTIAYAGAFTVVGGGDSAAAVAQMGIADRFTHVSTGGGASLAFVEGQKLPGLEALET